MKRILALLLALLLLTGCTPQTPPDPTQPTQPATQPATEPPTQPATQPVTEPATQPATEPATQPVTQPTTPPATEPQSSTQSTGLSVHFLDVNHADSILLACDGEYALVDGGYPESGDKIVQYLAKQGVEDLELVVGTHPHGDHLGGLPQVLNTYPTETIWTSQLPYSNDYVRDFTNAADDKLEQPRPGDRFQLGGATIEVIGPLNITYADANDLSLVLRVTYGDTRFLLTGDMEEFAERELVEAGVDLKADVLKVGHHGSSSSTSYRFLRAVAPTYGVISLAAANEYGHPHRDPLSRLMDADVTIYRTDTMYDIVAFSDGETVTFSWENTYANPWTPGDPR